MNLLSRHATLSELVCVGQALRVFLSSIGGLVSTLAKPLSPGRLNKLGLSESVSLSPRQ